MERYVGGGFGNENLVDGDTGEESRNSRSDRLMVLLETVLSIVRSRRGCRLRGGS